MKLLKRILCLAIVLATMMSMVLLPIPASADGPESTTNMQIIGASIRTSGTQGLRFIGRIKKDAYSLTYGDSANFGIMLIPKYMLSNGTTTITPSTSGKLTIAAKKAIEYNHPELRTIGIKGEPGYIYFVATVTGIAIENYQTDFYACVYFNSKYSATETRSVYGVANTIANSSDDNIPAAQKTACATIASTGASFGKDIVVDVGNVN